MSMTEDEAKTKWCPMVKTVSNVTGTNRDRYRDTSCIGSACMMWRVDEKADPAWSAPARGFCGLAGRPS